LERAIEKELLERLKSKAYGDAPLNVNESVWAAILDKEKARERGEELEEDESEEEEEELEGEVEEEREFVSDVSESGDELSDLEQITVRVVRCTFWWCESCIHGIRRAEWTVATTARSRETTTTQMQTRTRARNPDQNQNRHSANEKRNSVRANQIVRSLFYFCPTRYNLMCAQVDPA
jgi:Mak16 protein C-terminal region